MKNNPVYTIVYIIVFCVFSALLLTVPKEIWKGRIEANKLYTHKIAMVKAAGLYEESFTREQVEDIYTKQIAVENLGYMTLYVAYGKQGAPVAYLCDGEGMGHEGPFKYIAAFEPSAELEQSVRSMNEKLHITPTIPIRRSRKVKNLIVYELQETPGLGGRIADPEWASQFQNLIFEVPKKGSSDPKETEAVINFTDSKVNINDIVSVTGASSTMRSLNQSINKLAIAMNKGLMLIPLDLELSANSVTRATPGYPKGFKPPPNLRKLDKRPDFMVPEGLVNLACGCKVRLFAGNAEGITGDLSRLTDWNKKSNEDDYVEMLPNDMLQTIQVDLGDFREIFCIVVWHYYKNSIVYRDFIVQIADDPDMKVNSRILFNNDYDGDAGYGIGKDQQFFAGWWGELVDARPRGHLTSGRRARYVNISTRGGESEEDTRFVEIAVYGRETFAGEPVPEDSDDTTAAPATETAGTDTAVPATASKPKELSEDETIDAMQTDPKNTGLQLLEPSKLMTDADLSTPQQPSGYALPAAYTAKPIRQVLMVPPSVKLISKGCKVTSQPGEDGEPLDGQLSQLTDGIIGGSGSIVEMFPSTPQYVQVDLGAPKDITAIAVWHDYQKFTVYKDVVVMVADDAEMTQNRRIIYNNDADNSFELGEGKDPSYPATGHGHLFDARADDKPVKARYVRVTTNGSENGGEDTKFVEIAVFGE